MTSMIQDWIPFDDAPWSEDQRRSFDLIQAWDSALKAGAFSDRTPEELETLFQQEADRIAGGEAGTIIPRVTLEGVRKQVAGGTLKMEWFVDQVRAAHHYHGAIRFASNVELKQFLDGSLAPKGYLIASLADAAHRWQLPLVNELAVAFFLVKRLVQLPADLQKNQLYIPESDLGQAGITIEELKTGQNQEAIRKLLWKQMVRVRDAFAQGQPLLKEVPKKFRKTFKRNWLTGLEIANEIERRKYDLWSTPIDLSGVQQFQVKVLALIGRGVSKARGR